MQTTWAYLMTALVCYLPANTLPIMSTLQFGRENESTILGGVLLLWDYGSYPTALVIFFASVLIPLAKLMVLAWLSLSVSFRERLPASTHGALYKIVDSIGTWSMVDVFVVALLVALVRFTGILTITPGPAALAFCGLVVFTLLAAHYFDTRLLWDRA